VLGLKLCTTILGYSGFVFKLIKFHHNLKKKKRRKKRKERKKERKKEKKKKNCSIVLQ